MAVTRASFRAEFVEFANCDDAVIDAKLAAAALRTPSRIWGDLEDEGVKYLTAHLLACAPFSAELKLVDRNGDTRYGIERRTLERLVSSGFRVTGAGT